MRALLAALVLAAVGCGATAAPETAPRSVPRRSPPAVPAPVLKPVAPLPPPPMVHVEITRASAAGRARVRVRGAWSIATSSGAAWKTGTSLDADLAFDGAFVTLAGESVPPDAELRPASDGDLALVVTTGGKAETRTYPGALRVDRGRDAKWRVFVVLDVESYVAAVVNAEIPAQFGREAQRTQAVIARTYALASTVRTSPTAPLEVADIGGIDQEFTGLAALPEHRRIGQDAAVSTRGLVLTEEGMPFVAYYHSTCGGATCPGREVFGAVASARALGGAIACPWCAGTKYAVWEATIPAADVVKAAGLTGRLESFTLPETTSGGRATVFEIKAGGRTKRVRAAEFRLRAGPSLLRSTMLDLAVVDGDRLVVKGRGWGHGVGLCQMGAKALAERGLKAEAILGMYYPGALLEPRW